MKSSLIVLLAFSALVSCALQPIATLDNFSGTQNVLVVTNNVFPATSSSFFNSSSVYGGQRDLELIVESGGAAQIFITNVADNKLSSSSPNSGNGYTIYQLDGLDDSVNIDQTGLNNFDATFSGTASGFQLTGASDVATHLNITVYTSSGIGKYHLDVPSSFTESDFYIPFSSFSGNANFASVGAIEIFFDGSSDVDSVYSFFGIVSEEGKEEESSQTTAATTADVPQSPLSPVSTNNSPATAKGNSNPQTSFHSSDDSSSASILSATMMLLAVLFVLL